VVHETHKSQQKSVPQRFWQGCRDLAVAISAFGGAACMKQAGEGLEGLKDIRLIVSCSVSTGERVLIGKTRLWFTSVAN
jgi:hypothetical protein